MTILQWSALRSTVQCFSLGWSSSNGANCTLYTLRLQLAVAQHEKMEVRVQNVGHVDESVTNARRVASGEPVECV